jgi:hypothetical protein
LLCVLAADDAVAAVTEALIGFGCFFGDPVASLETVGPTDCERITGKLNQVIKLKSNQKLAKSNLL